MIKREDLKKGMMFTLPVIDHGLGITSDECTTVYGTKNVQISVPVGVWIDTFSFVKWLKVGSMILNSPNNVEIIIEREYVDEVLSAAEPVEKIKVVNGGEILTKGVETPLHKDEGGLGGGREDNVNHPSHYAWLKDVCGVEPLDVCRHLSFNVGNAVKYLLRKGKKDGDKTEKEKRMEDLRKAAFYIEDEIRRINEMDATVETAAHKEGDGE